MMIQSLICLVGIWNENKFKKERKETGTGLAFFGYLVDETPTIRHKDNKWYDLLSYMCLHSIILEYTMIEMIKLI